MTIMVAAGTSALKAYQPTPECPWNVRRVVHLHRRAGFAGTWNEIERDLHGGPEPAVARFLNGTTSAPAPIDDFESLSTGLSGSAVRDKDPKRLQAWWLQRMVFSPDPLREKLALLWHNHFATSNLKLNDPALMFRQNQIFRTYGSGPFGELLSTAVKDPAILLWLDAHANRKEHPNENLGRELMELFSLGIGNYSESDVKEAARALTGWRVVDKSVQFVAEHHDGGQKTILGQTGAFRGDDLLEIVVRHPATANRLARRLCGVFLSDAVANETVVSELAAGLRDHDLNIAWAVEAILRSQAFFADENIGTNVLGPVEFVVGAVRALEYFDPAPSTLLLAEWTRRIGQSLFYPPNVFGWPARRSWITSRSLLMRAMFVEDLVDGTMCRPNVPLGDSRSAARHCQNRDRRGQIEFFCRLLMPACTDSLIERFQGVVARDEKTKEFAAADIVRAVLSSPEAQIG